MRRPSRPKSAEGAVGTEQKSLFPDEPDDASTPPVTPDQTPWRRGWQLNDEEVAFFRERSVSSRVAKEKAMRGEGRKPLHPVNNPKLAPADLMPQRPRHGLRSLSLFSGGGGLDLGFDLAGYDHVASYDLLPVASETLLRNRSSWRVYTGEEAGDVSRQDWNQYRNQVDVVHGGPPCQPFSSAGRQLGQADTRDAFPHFVNAVLAIRPRAFVAENVAALTHKKFQDYLDVTVFQPLQGSYRLDMFILKAEWFGVPQIRTRLFIVGIRTDQDPARFCRPTPTHQFQKEVMTGGRSSSEAGLFDAAGDARTGSAIQTMGVREALGLPNIGYDDLAPTLRSGFTGPRGATSVNSSVSALKAWGRLGIWPNGVAVDREAAHKFVPENNHFRLSLADVAVIQGFPESWRFCGAVYSTLGQIGNSVAPPVAYRVARAVADALVGAANCQGNRI